MKLTELQRAILLDVSGNPNIKSTELGPIMRDAITDLLFATPTALLGMNPNGTLYLTKAGREAFSK